MVKKPNLQEVDVLLVDHKHLMNAILVSGIERSFNDPTTGLTFLLTRDKHFTDEWHESGHSFISQRSDLGLLLCLFSALLHAMFIEAETEHFEENEYLKKVNTFKKVRAARDQILERFALSHEIFAMGTEVRAIIQDSISKGGFVLEIEKRAADSLANLTIEVGKSGSRIHKRAMEIIMKISDIYGHYSYATAAAECIINYGICLIVNTDPKELFFGEGIETIYMPPVDEIYDKLLHPPHDWAPGRSFYEGQGAFLRNVIQEISKLSPSKNIFSDLKNLGYWIANFKSILPLNERCSKLFDSIMTSTLNYVLIGGSRRQSQLQKYAEIYDIEEQEYWEHMSKTGTKEFMNYIADSLGLELDHKQKMIIQDPLIIPPPLAMIIDGEGLKLYIRDDANTPDGIYHMAYRSSYMAIIEDIINRDSKPVFCFFEHCKLGNEKCKEGPCKCKISRLMKKMLCNYYEANQERLDPVLVCCHGNLAQFVEFKDWNYNPEISCELPFRLIPFIPKLVGRKISKST